MFTCKHINPLQKFDAMEPNSICEIDGDVLMHTEGARMACWQSTRLVIERL